MFDVAKSAVTGRYQQTGNLNNADCLIGQSFGMRSKNGQYTFDQANGMLARYAFDLVKQYESIRQKAFPTILQVEIANIYENETHLTASKIIDKARDGEYLDSWEVLEQSMDYMEKHNLEHPIIVAQAHHVGRVALQAIKMGIDPIVAGNLPSNFDTQSEQWWTRSRGLWVIREIPGLAVLKAKGKL